MTEPKTARTFGKSKEVKSALASLKQKVYRNEVEMLVNQIACDFKVWQLQWDAYHGEMSNTLERLITGLKDLQDLNEYGPESKVLSINRDKEKA